MSEPEQTSGGPPAQHRVATRVVARKAPVRGASVLLRVGPYDVVRPLVRAPGAFLAEARGPNGETVCLQMTPLRAAVDEADGLARRALERELARATAALFTEQDITVMAHGAASREDGVRVLFWALPWRPGADGRLGSPALFVEGSEHLLVLARSLAQRLARRHLLKSLEPLLCEHLLSVQSTEAELLGVPVAVPPDWLAPETLAPRWAPEERRDGQPAETGDLWRLGHTLRALATAFDTVPQGLDRLITRLISEDPKARPPRATEVVVAVEAIHAALGRGLPLVPLEATPTVSMQTLPIEALAELMQVAVGQTRELAPDPTPRLLGGAEPTVEEPSDRTLPDLPPVMLETPAFNDAPMLDQVPPWAFFFTLDELRSFLELVAADLGKRELEFIFGTGVVQLALPDGGSFYYLGLVPLAHACHGAERARWSTIIRRELDGLLEATAREPERRRFRNDRGAAPGEAGPTRLLTPVEVPTAPAITLETTTRSGRWYVMGGVIALLLFGAILVGARDLDRPTLLPQHVSPRHAVELVTEPANAWVVAEASGEILGHGKQQFWSGPDVDAHVLVAAPGRLPRRVRLPARGSLHIELDPLPDKVDRCAMDLEAADAAQFETIGGPPSVEGRLRVEGAALVRARDGRGAWIVRCGGGPVALQDVSHPDREIVVDLDESVEIGGVELSSGQRVTTQRAFVRMTFDGASRWVPTHRPTRIGHP